MGVDIVLV